MRINIVEIDGSVDEVDSSKAVAELLARVKSASVGQAGRLVHVAEVERSGPPAADSVRTAETGTLPGVPAEGQAAVRRLLERNAAQGLLVKFLAVTAAWPSVKVHGVKSKGALAGEPLDYTRYLRLRKQRSRFGGFAYVWPSDGTVNMRLRYDTDADLATVAPDARRLDSGHPEYRVSIRIVDEHRLKQALDLAQRAYDAT